MLLEQLLQILLRHPELKRRYPCQDEWRASEVSSRSTGVKLFQACGNVSAKQAIMLAGPAQ
jgi:hypothetical protein